LYLIEPLRRATELTPIEVYVEIPRKLTTVFRGKLTTKS